MSVKKSDIIEAIEKELGPRLTRKDITKVVTLFLKEISKHLSENKRVELRGFGVFKTSQRKAKHIKNPKTGKEMHIPARLVPVFKVSKILKQMVSQR